jgi:hypothetical protein
MSKAPKMLDPFTHNAVFYDKVDVQKDPTFGDTLAASIGYQYDPILEHIKNVTKFGSIVDKNYNSLEDMDGYEAYEGDLIFAQNAEHMKELKRAIDENNERRRVLANSSFGSHFFAGLADPINLVALPFGGVSIGIGRSFLRTGTSVGALQAAQEVARAPFDPLNTVTESAINISSAFAAGGLLGSAISVPATRRAKAYKPTIDALGERRLAHEVNVDTNLPTPTAERPMSQVSNGDIDAALSTQPRVINTLNQSADDAEASLNANRQNMPEAEVVQLEAKIKADRDRAAELQNEYNLFKQEALNRNVTESQIEAGDYNLPSNLWTDSWAYKFVTTPMKRVLQNNDVPDFAKKVILGIAGDSGILLNLHKKGLRLGPSAYQKAAMRDGEWVQVYDNLRSLFGEEYKVGKQTVLDYDIGGAAQKVAAKVKAQPQTKTFYDWITEVNIKRMKGEAPATKAESTAIAKLDEFYAQWEKRLGEVGLIGSQAHYKNQRIRLDTQIVEYKEIIKSLEAKQKAGNITGAESRRLQLNKDRVAKKTSELEEVDFQIETMKDVRLMPANEDVFNPRYWNKEAIAANRQAFFEILYRWYKENPQVYKQKLDAVTKKPTGWERVALDTSDSAVTKRVDDTIDKILGVTDPTSPELQFFGFGRSKHFRHREIDIPNSLVTDFIETNPLNIMKTYTAKIAPQYEFHAKFGKGIDDVLDDVEDAMLATEKMSQRQIDSVLKDMRHLNDRVHGTVIRDPEALNLKAAIILKDLAMLNYLGSAGFATLPDFAKVMMEHELGTVWKSLFGVMSDNRVRLTSEEGRIAGEIIDILKGDAHLRFTEYMRNNPLNEGLMSKVRTGFFMLNGVAPMTTIFKKLDAIARGHTLIDYSIKVAKGEASDMEIAYLARYNIDKAEAIKIANAPWDKTEAGLYLPNTREWTTGRVETKNYVDLGNETIVARYGDEFNVQRVVTDVDEYAAARKKFGWKDDEDGIPLGHHEYIHNEKGIVYVNLEKIDEMFEALSNKAKRKEFQETVTNRIKEVTALPDSQAKLNRLESLSHAEFRLKNADKFKSPKDVADFILLHEMTHGKIKRNPNETSIKYENRINRLAMNRLKKEKPKVERIASQETVENFRTAMNSGIGNTVLMGTPADKPIAVDGVFYIPIHVARKIHPNIKADAKYKGYYRVENGLLGLPFQFMSYSFAAANKITASLAQGQIKNRAVAMSASMGLGYMGMELKYSDWQMEQMSWPDVIARSFDASGLAAMHSDLFYTAMGTSLALGGPEIGGGLIKPKFQQDKSAVDAFTSVAGAGPSYAVDVGRALGKFIEGDYSQGTSDLIRRLGPTQLWFLKDETNSIARAFAGGRY